MNFLIKYRSGNSISLNHFYLSTLQKAVLLVLLFVPFWASAQTDLSVDKNGMVAIPEPPNPPKLVNDFADVLTPEQEQTLESRLVTIDNGSSVQIAVVTVKTTGIVPITDYAQSLFTKWGIGQKGKNNGLLITVAIDDRKSDINVGYGLEGVVADADARVLLREVLKPYFKEGLYYEGLTATTDSLFKLSQGEYKFDAEKANKGNTKKKEKGISFWIVLVIIAVIILSRFGKGGGRNNRGGGLSDVLIPAILFGSGRGGSSWGNFSGGSGSFGGGGSFGGFGGGSSGGGGASGSW